MFPASDLIPRLPSPLQLTRRHVSDFQDDLQRLRVFHPAATARAFVPRDVAKAVQYEFDVSFDDLTDLQILDHLHRFVAPRTADDLRAQLADIRCGDTPTVSRVANVREYCDEFVDLYTARAMVEADIATQLGSSAPETALVPLEEAESPLSDDDHDDDEQPDDASDRQDDPPQAKADAFERAAAKLLRRNLAPAAFASVVDSRYQLARPSSLLANVALIQTVADEEDTLRDSAARFGISGQRPFRGRGQKVLNSTTTRGCAVYNPRANTDNRDNRDQCRPRDQRPGPKGANTQRPFDGSKARPCRVCGGQHWDRDCPQRRTRTNGGLRENPRKAPVRAVSKGMSSTITVNDRLYPVVIDTGAGISCISEAAACDQEENGIHRQRGPPVLATTAGEATIRSNEYIGSRLSVSNICGWPVRFAGDLLIIPGDKLQVLIGTDLLEDIGALTSEGLVIEFSRAGEQLDTSDDIPSNYIDEGVQLNAVGIATPTLEQDPLDLVQIPESPVQDELRALVREYADIFGPLAPEGAALEPQRIPLTDETALVQLRARPLSNVMRVKVGDEVDRLEREGIIEDSQGPYSSPIVVVNKKTGEIRLCVDYTLLNRLTIPDLFPLPDLRTFLTRAAGCVLFAALDLAMGYHQQIVHPADVPKTAFVTPDRYCQFRRVPFGLRNAPAGFQRAMQKALAPLLDRGVAVYIDDLLAYARNDMLFLELIRRLFGLLRHHRLRLKPSKCVLGAAYVKSVGFVVDQSGIRVDPERVTAIHELHTPEDLTSLRTVIGKFNYVAQFIPDLARRVATLNELTKKGVEFIWTAKHQDAFDSVKKSIAAETTLAFPSLNGTSWDLYTDASTAGIGGVLFQTKKEEGAKREIVSFFSRKFTETQSRWTTYEQELYGIIYCLSRPELSPLFRLHPDLTVHTDHRNLVYLQQSAPSNRKIMRWKLLLADYPITIVHVAGSENVIADVLSRHINVLQTDKLALLERYHVGSAGHQKPHNMIKQLHADGQTWDGMCGDVRQYVRECLVCQRTQRPRKQPTQTHSTHTLTPFSLVQMDTVGPLPEQRGMRYVIVFIDCFTKFVDMTPVPTTSAKDAAEALLAVWSRYGVPRVLQSDRGSQFLNKLIADITEIIGGTHRFSTAYHPASNGIVERANGTLMNTLRALLLDQKTEDWCRMIPVVQHVYNTTIHSSTGVTPFEALYGSTEATPVQDPDVWLRAYGALDALGASWGRKFNEWRQALDASRTHAVDKLSQQTPTPTEGAINWQPGQLALITHAVKQPKLSPRLRGPLEVIRRGESPNTWYLMDIPTKIQFLIHQERMIPFYTSLPRAELDLILNQEVGYYEVDRITNHRLGGTDGKTLQIRVRWLGYQPEEDSWETFTREHNELEALDDYLSNNPDARPVFERVSRRWQHPKRRR